MKNYQPFYQPVISIEDSRVFGHEILARDISVQPAILPMSLSIKILTMNLEMQLRHQF